MRKRATKLLRGGFSLVEMMITVCVLGILMAIAVPSFVRARAQSRHTSCLSNLRVIDSAKEEWAMDTHAKEGAAVQMSDIAGSYIKGPVTGPLCPSGGTYQVNRVGTAASCSVDTPLPAGP